MSGAEPLLSMKFSQNAYLLDTMLSIKCNMNSWKWEIIQLTLVSQDFNIFLKDVWELILLLALLLIEFVISLKFLKLYWIKIQILYIAKKTKTGIFLIFILLLKLFKITLITSKNSLNVLILTQSCYRHLKLLRNLESNTALAKK